MHLRALGPGAPAVSAIGYGAMPLSLQSRPHEAVAVRVIHAVLDAGVTLIDTANVYCLDHTDIGHNERLIAKALKSWSGARDTVLVATKGGLARPKGRWESDARPDRLKRACEQSLRDLGIDCIDLYQLHAPDPRVPFADSVGALAQLREAGKIRWVGLSNVSVGEIRQAESLLTVTAVQNRLNPFFREALVDGVVAYCQRRGIGFIAYSPMGGWQYHKALSKHRALNAIAEQRGYSPHAVTLAWLLAQAPNIIPIPAARSVEHVHDSLRAIDLTLTADHIKAINAARF
jgi:aryl-alcohol dehydrogenase-like predicted oxidoreductase